MEEVVRHGDGEDCAAPGVRPGSANQRRVVVQQHTRRSSLTVAKLLVSPTKGLAVGKRQQRVESNQKRKRVLIYF